MLDDSLNIFTRDLCQFLSGQDEVATGSLIKKHSVNLRAQGEFSFPNIAKPWREYINRHKSDSGDSSFLKCIGKEIEDIGHASEKWQLPVKVAIEIKDRVHLFLNRCYCINVGLANGAQNSARIKSCLSGKKSVARVEPRSVGACVTYVRAKCLAEVIDSLLAIRGAQAAEPPPVVVTSKPPSSCAGGVLVVCGTVLNANTNAKENALRGEDFIRIRQRELTLIAQHKYGVRTSSHGTWKEYIAHLGESAVIFEMLQTKPACAVKINFGVTSGSSKGAAFVLYNCARLETILRTYNEGVCEGRYPPLPDFESTDFTLLTQEDEWCLIFNYILGLPALLKSCVQLNVNSCEFRPHLLCGFLSAMVKSISQYYRRTRILTEPREHLLPVMFARLHLLQTLNETLKACLLILNIKSVSQM